MAEYRTLKMNLWSDPFIESLSPHGKLLYLYLITSPHTNNLGIIEVSRRRMSVDTGLDESEVDTELDHLKNHGKAIEVDGVLWLTNFISNQTSCSPKLVEGLKKISSQIKSLKLKRMIWERYPFAMKAVPDGIDTESYPIDTLSKGMDTLCIPPAEVEVEVEVEVEKEEEEEEERKYKPKTLGQKKSKSLPSVDEIIEQSFPEFWAHYPKKAAKADAKKAFASIIQNTPMKRMKATLENISSHLYTYLDEIEEHQTDEKYIKYPASWLRAQDFSEPPGVDNP